MDVTLKHPLWSWILSKPLVTGFLSGVFCFLGCRAFSLSIYQSLFFPFMTSHIDVVFLSLGLLCIWFFDSGIIITVIVSGLMAAFFSFYSEDQLWECGPCEVPREIELLKSRVKLWNHYPDGVDNCIQFLQKCQDENCRFVVKAVKTFPCWTWYFYKADAAHQKTHEYQKEETEESTEFVLNEDEEAKALQILASHSFLSPIALRERNPEADNEPLESFMAF